MPAYLSAALLIIAFVHGYDAWVGLTAILGRDAGAWVPVAAALAVPPGAALAVRGATGRPTIRPGLVAGGVVLAVAALALCDGDFPAKRVHVAEYLLVAFAVRKGASARASGWALTATTVIVATLLGIHDELIQGLHPKRTFGLSDIGVDGLSALAGALIGQGLEAFEPKTAPAFPAAPPPMGPWAWGLGALGLGVGLMLAGLWRTGIRLPDMELAAPPALWTAAPLLGGAAALALLDRPRDGWAGHLLDACLILTLPMPLYLVIPHVAPLAFR